MTLRVDRRRFTILLLLLELVSASLKSIVAAFGSDVPAFNGHHPADFVSLLFLSIILSTVRCLMNFWHAEAREEPGPRLSFSLFLTTNHSRTRLLRLFVERRDMGNVRLTGCFILEINRFEEINSINDS